MPVYFVNTNALEEVQSGSEPGINIGHQKPGTAAYDSPKVGGGDLGLAEEESEDGHYVL